MSSIEDLQQELRAMRARYDALSRGETAPLRRCRTAAEMALEPGFFRVAGALVHTQHHLAHVALLFPLALHAKTEGFSFGRFLRRRLGKNEGGKMRFRRALDSRDRDELDHRLRGLLKLAAADKARVDWGVLGVDLLWFFAQSDNVRRRWAQDFYAPIPTTVPAV